MPMPEVRSTSYGELRRVVANTICGCNFGYPYASEDCQHRGTIARVTEKIWSIMQPNENLPDDPGPIVTVDWATENVLNDLRDEIYSARQKHAPMNSPHEGHSVIREELERELWEHVCTDTGRSPEARKEALQVAAMAVRYILDLIDTGVKK